MVIRHRSLRPRAHWLLFTLGLISLLTALGADGFAQPRASGTGLSSFGVFSTRDALGGPVVDPEDGGSVVRRLPPRTAALTFEDGPDPVWTPRILDLLRDKGIKATFFVVGSRVNRFPDLTRRIVKEGHEIGLHSFNHADVAGLPARQRRLQLDLTRDAVARATGLDVRTYRPPYSATPATLDRQSVTALKEAVGWGYRVVLADLDSGDHLQPGHTLIAAAAAPFEDTGSIILMHDGGGDRAQTIAALELLIPSLEENGYRFTTVAGGIDTGPSAAVARPGQRVRAAATAIVQHVAAGVTRLLFVLLIVAAVLTTLRVSVQFGCAWLHRRRRRSHVATDGYRPAISVVVPAYNEAANIAATVKSLVATGYPDLEIIVVDDGSDDGTGEIVARLNLPGVRLLAQPNRGKSVALSTGIAEASHDILVLIDGDTIVEPQTLHLLVEPFLDPAVGGVAGNAKVANRSGLLGRLQHTEYVVAFNLERRVFEVGDCMPTVPGALGAFRREALREAGGISTQTLAEDTDLTMAVCRAGWRIVYRDSACAWTEAPGTWRGLWRQRLRWCFGTMQAMWKHRAAVVQRGASGKLGRRGLTYLLVFQILQPLLAPIADVYLIYNLVFEPFSLVAVLWLALTGMQLAVALYAFRLDREPSGPIWTLLLQQVVYRQLIYLVVIQSVVTALVGSRVAWHQPARKGHAAALTDQPALVTQVVRQRQRRNRRPAPMWARAFVWFGVTLLMLSAGVAGTTQMLLSRVQTAVNQGDLLGRSATFHNGGLSGFSSGGPLNFLIIGLDWRRDEPGPIRADTIMVMHVSPSRDRAYLLSLPRDTIVEAPPMPEVDFPGGFTRLNSTFTFGAGDEMDRERGARFLAENTRQLTGLPGFDGALMIDFYGFMEVVKAFDGIDLCVETETESFHSGVVYPAGCGRMDAVSALDYIRQRKSLAGGDYARQRHQQQLIKSIVREARATDVVTDPARLDRILQSAGSSMTICTGPMTPLNILLALRGVEAEQIALVRIAGSGEHDEHGNYRGERLSPEANDLFAALREQRLDAYLAAHPHLLNQDA